MQPAPLRGYGGAAMISLFSSPKLGTEGRRTWPLQVWYWLLFGAVQIAGFILAEFANVHTNPLGLLIGVALLFPGILVSFVFQLPDPAALPLVVFINAAAWYVLRKNFMPGRT
jgi:hypothetical protein